MTDIPYFVGKFDDPRYANALKEVLDSGWLTTGKVCERLESRFSTETDGLHAVAVSSATTAALMLFSALGIREGHEVVFPSLTFSGPPMMARLLGATVRFADVDGKSLTLTTRTVEPLVNHRTAAVVVTNYAGKVCPDLEDMAAMLKRRNVYLIEDAAHCFPSRDRQGHVPGTHSLAAFYSFYANKTVPAGEGGMISTRNPKLAEDMRVTRLHGMSADAMSRFQTNQIGYDVMRAGFKANMSDVTAALANASLDDAHLHRYIRQCANEAYLAMLGNGARPAQYVHKDEVSAHHLMPVLVDDRERSTWYLREAGVGYSLHYKPLHQHSFWKTQPATTYDAKRLPTTEFLGDHLLSLPMHPHLTGDEIRHVCEALRNE